MYRFRGPPTTSTDDSEATEVLLVHPGGPYWANKDEGSWSLPKGEYGPGADPLTVAKTEFEEELGKVPPPGPFRELGSVKQRGGKVVLAWAAEGDLDTSDTRSNTFEIEWPPRSGRRARFPEIDRATWFNLEEAERRLLKSQLPFISRLKAMVGSDR